VFSLLEQLPSRHCHSGLGLRSPRRFSYNGYRFPPEIIRQAIWLHVRFTLSFRDVEDLMAESRFPMKR
jgi:transposase-like protein